MKKAQRKDFFREIWKSKNRFISILLITALGVSFYAGVRSAEPDMNLTADQRYDETNYMDIRVIGTLGLTEDDLEAIRQIPGVKQAEPAMQTEAVCKLADNENILQVFSLMQDINQMQIEAGRLPENSGECFADTQLIQAMGLELGDSITLTAGTSLADGEKADILDTLVTDTYTIVGYGRYAEYLTWDRGTATIGDGKNDGYIGIGIDDFYQDPDAVQAPIYHNIYLTVDGAWEKNCYADDYEDLIDEVVEQVEAIADERCEIRYTAIKSDAEEQLADAKTEIADAEAEIADAEAELADAAQEIADAEEELADGRQELEDGRQEIADGEKELADGRKQLNDAKADLADGWKEYEKGKAELEEKEAELLDGEAQLMEGREEIDAQRDTLDSGREEYEAGLAQLEAARLELDTQKTQLTQAEEQFFAGFAAMGITDREQVMAYVQRDPELSAQYQQIEEGKAAVTAGEQTLAEKETMLVETGEQLTAGEEALEEAGRTWQDSWNQLQEGKLQITESKETLAEALQQLEESEAELADAMAELEDREAELADAKADLAEGEAELLDGEAELADGKAEYEEKKAEADVELTDAKLEIADGKLDLADAEADLAELEEPEWLVLKRSDSVQNFIEYGMDAERIGAIGEVFPALFFLVAALVCLTTMTRMVEEERTQIGTMKALGYSKASIASKYILYALSACLIGGVLGVLVGSSLYPYVIIKAYQILYDNTPEPVMPLHMNLAVMSILIAVCCTVFATAMSCYKELAGVPAELMRPAAPKQGKRVLLERITFLWKHLSFTWKATIRNLFRYKKRLFMTIFGIGGSMALLMVGFGLRDSIQQIVNNQYKTLWTYDAYLSLEEDQSNEEKIAYSMAVNEAESGIQKTLCVRSVTMDVENAGVTKNAYLFVPERLDEIDQFLNLRNRLSGERYSIEEGGVVISEKLSQLLGVSVGDTFYLVKNETEKYPVTITAIVENYMNHYVYLTADTYKDIFGEEPEYNQLYLKMEELNTEEKNELSARMLEEEIVQSLTYVEDLQNKVADLMKSLDLVVVVLIVAAGLLAFVVLYNLNNISIMERRRELATLKVLGFYDIEVAEYVYRENILLTFFGILAGVVLGLFLHQFVIRTCEIDMVMFGRDIKPLSYLFSILLTILFATIVNFGMFYKLRKIDMVESLKSVE